jgi:DnaK suppressor protein
MSLAKAVLKSSVELPEGYDPVKDEDYMGELHFEYFRQQLTSWKETLLRESKETLDHLKEENWQEPDINDRATVETDTAFELRTRDR